MDILRPDWRSLLFVPADNPARQAKARTVGADAVILDLEDGVAAAAKAGARATIKDAVRSLAEAGVDVVVRINTRWRDIMADLDAAVHPGVRALMVPKVEDPARLQVIAEMLAEFEAARDIAAASIGLVALIESPAGLAQMSHMAHVDRVIGLALGTEDFSLELGVAPSPDVLDLPARQVALAAATRKLMALAAPISVAEFRDRDAYAAAVRRAAGFGATGALCIHPTQVEAANACFQPAPEAVARARDIVAAWEAAQAQGQAITTLGGLMIDLPIAARAKRLLEKAK